MEAWGSFKEGSWKGQESVKEVLRKCWVSEEEVSRRCQSSTVLLVKTWLTLLWKDVESCKVVLTADCCSAICVFFVYYVVPKRPVTAVAELHYYWLCWQLHILQGLVWGDNTDLIKTEPVILARVLPDLGPSSWKLAEKKLLKSGQKIFCSHLRRCLE